MSARINITQPAPDHLSALVWAVEHYALPVVTFLAISLVCMWAIRSCM